MLTQSQLRPPAPAIAANLKQVVKTDESAKAVTQNAPTVRNISRVSQLRQSYEN